MWLVRRMVLRSAQKVVVIYVLITTASAAKSMGQCYLKLETILHENKARREMVIVRAHGPSSRVGWYKLVESPRESEMVCDGNNGVAELSLPPPLVQN